MLLFNFNFLLFLERTCIFLNNNNVFLQSFFHFLKREKNWWMINCLEMRDVGFGRKHFFFSLKQKRNVSESIFFFLRCSLFGVFSLLFANVQKVSRRLVVKFLLGHCKFRTDI